MRHVTIAAAIAAACLGTPAAAHGQAHTHKHHHGATAAGARIVVSCFRGPWREVIWDRPNAVFVDSLVSAGYDYPAAHAIGERICRDATLVGNPAALKSTMEQILRDPKSGRRGY